MPDQDEFDEPGNRLLLRMREKLGSRDPLAARRPGVAYGIAGSLVILLLAVIWAGYPHGKSGTGGALPVIHAEAGPIRTAPEAEGGMDIPNRESTVFNAVRGRNAGGHIENLLPGAEQPVDRSRVFGAAAPAKAGPAATDTKTKLMQLADATTADGGPAPAQTTQLGDAPGFAPEPAPSTVSTAPADTADRLANKSAAKVAPGTQPKASTPAANSSTAPAVNAPSPLPQTQSVPRSGGAAQGSAKPDAATAHPPVEDGDQSDATDAPASLAPLSGGKAESAAVPAKGGKYIQLAALADKSAAPRTWKGLQSRFPAQLKAASYRIVPAQVKGHTFYRVQAGPMDPAEAVATCRTINAGKPGACLAVNG